MYQMRLNDDEESLVALAEVLRLHNRTADGFTPEHLLQLADFWASQGLALFAGLTEPQI